MPTLCHIFESIDESSAIAKVAMAGVRVALDAGFQVTVVAKRLHESLHGKVNWLRLSCPPRGFALQWLTARYFIVKALGGREFDVVHGHQPQIADLCDVFQCHFLTRVAYERNCLESRPGLRPALIRAQQSLVLRAEDGHYSSWNASTQLVFCSKLLQSEFIRLYGSPARHEVLIYGVPPTKFATTEQRRAARQKVFNTQEEGLVVGYLGGIQARKGYKLLLDALSGQQAITLLMGGQYTADFKPPAAFTGKLKTLGLVKDTATFYAACNVVAVPSHFDPCPLVVFEASSRGTPVLATDGCGNSPTILEYGAGRRWDPASQPLAPIIREMAESVDSYRAGIRTMNESLSAERYGNRLLSIYESVMKQGRKPRTRTVA